MKPKLDGMAWVDHHGHEHNRKLCSIALGTRECLIDDRDVAVRPTSLKGAIWMTNPWRFRRGTPRSVRKLWPRALLPHSRVAESLPPSREPFNGRIVWPGCP